MGVFLSRVAFRTGDMLVKVQGGRWVNDRHTMCGQLKRKTNKHTNKSIVRGLWLNVLNLC